MKGKIIQSKICVDGGGNDHEADLIFASQLSSPSCFCLLSFLPCLSLELQDGMGSNIDFRALWSVGLSNW